MSAEQKTCEPPRLELSTETERQAEPGMQGFPLSPQLVHIEDVQKEKYHVLVEVAIPKA